jgi:DUF971 family protein
MSSHWPTEIRLAKDRKSLKIAFEDGTNLSIPAELLRVESPSAEVQGHGPTEKKIIPGKQNVEIIGVEPVGHYGVKLSFDDMHDTGIFGWDYLRDLGLHQDARMQAYLDNLQDKGLTRSPMRT